MKKAPVEGIFAYKSSGDLRSMEERVEPTPSEIIITSGIAMPAITKIWRANDMAISEIAQRSGV